MDAADRVARDIPTDLNRRRQKRRTRVILEIELVTSHAHGHTAAPTPTTEHIDPVCGMTVDPADAAGSYQYRGHRYYFCNPSCLERFQANPEEFLQADAKAPVVVPAARAYVCPMDPEVRQSEPGACPKCGMALEPDLSDPAALMKVEYTCPMHPGDRPR